MTNETVDKPLKVFDAYDDRNLIENCCIKESKQAWNLKNPPKKTERTVQVYVLFTLAMFVLATAYRLRAEQAAVGDESIGWQRWRRNLIQRNRDKVMIFAQEWYGIFHTLITFAYNTASTGLSVCHGMYPREPLYRMIAPASIVEQKLTASGYDVTPFAPSSESREWIGQINESVLGFRRDSHHGFLLQGGTTRAVQIEHAGKPAGYAHISRDSQVGPLAIAPYAEAKCVIERRFGVH